LAPTGILLRFHHSALVKEKACCMATGQAVGNATAEEKRRAIKYFIWIVAFTNGSETDQSDLL
jgi:hypothetical protein